MQVKKGDIIKAKTFNKVESFKIVRVGRKYAYCVSAQYGSDGLWRIEKALAFDTPDIVRC